MMNMPQQHLTFLQYGIFYINYKWSSVPAGSTELKEKKEQSVL